MNLKGVVLTGGVVIPWQEFSCDRSRYGTVIPGSAAGACPATLTRSEDHEQRPLGGHSTVAGKLEGSSSVPRSQ